MLYSHIGTLTSNTILIVINISFYVQNLEDAHQNLKLIHFYKAAIS